MTDDIIKVDINGSTLKKRSSRAKKIYPGMYPKKKWLSTSEASAFLDISVKELKEIRFDQQLSLSTLPPMQNREKSNKYYYRASELIQLIEDNILFQKPSYQNIDG